MTIANERAADAPIVGAGASSTRRNFIGSMLLGMAGAPLMAAAGIRAIAFDAFVLFDPAKVVAAARAIVGEKASEFVAAAGARLFAYSWFYTSAHKYEGFERLAADSFRYSARIIGFDLAETDLRELVGGYSALSPWADVPPALALLREHGVRLAVLSNLPARLLLSNLRAGGIERHFERVLSTDEVRKFKPAPEAYALAVQALKLSREQIGFAASAGWDASGASWFGYPTVWVNRNQLPHEEAYAAPQLVSRGMDGVLWLAGTGSA